MGTIRLGHIKRKMLISHTGYSCSILILHLLPRSEHRLQSAKPPDMLFPLHDVPFAPIALQLPCRVLSKAANPSRSPGY